MDTERRQNFRGLISALKLIDQWNTRVLISVSGCALILITLSFVTEVFLRYFFGSPTDWVNDLVRYLLPVVIFGTAPYVVRVGSHVSIDYLESLLSGVSRVLLHSFVLVAAMSICLVTGAIVLAEAHRQFERGIYTVGTQSVPKWWITSVIATGFLSMAFSYMTHLLGAVLGEARDQ
ncbi:TRAP transporter small permease [Roseovarius sp. CAU 1744]|uniref:TRAP transporter small permease n=1 Tax=Roseovarius sp. CAU 1744 TaxID=3140368 RepID=UPI00325A770D